MLVCEGATLTRSALALRWEMADSSLEGSQNLDVYTVLVAISTFCALTVTLLLLFVPTQVRPRLESCAVLVSCEKF